MDKFKVTIWVSDTTGRTVKSDRFIMESPQVDNLYKLFSNPRELKYLEISSKKTQVFIHPDQVVSIRLKVRKISPWWRLLKKV